MQIPFNDLSRKFVGRYRAMLDSFELSLAKTDFILGQSVTNFEIEFSNFIGSKFAIGVNSGTDALTIAIRTLILKSGRELKIGTTANAGGYTTIAAMLNQLEVIFVDIDKETLQINLDGVKELADRGCEIIVVTHLYGLANPEIFEIAEFCQKQGLYLIEDCAQAHGLRIEGKHVGTFGNISTFSFYPTKNLGCIGDGGAVVTNSPEMNNKIKSLRTYGWQNKYEIEISGGTNSRLDSIQAQLLLTLIPYLENQNQERKQIARKYQAQIRNSHIKKLNISIENYNGHIFPVMTANRKELMKYLAELGIETTIHYPIPDHKQKAWKNGFGFAYNLPITEKTCSEILSLPIFPGMQGEEIDYVINSINSFNIK